MSHPLADTGFAQKPIVSRFPASIILPFSALQIRNHNQVKDLYQHRIGDKNQYQLDQVKQKFDKTKSDMLMTALQLEKEREVMSALHDQTDALPAVIAPSTLVGKENRVVQMGYCRPANSCIMR